MCDLGGLVKSVLLRMMLHPYGPKGLPRLTKQLKQASIEQLGWGQIQDMSGHWPLRLWQPMAA